MHVLLISSDHNIFKEDSIVQKRMCAYGTIFGEVHIIVFTKLENKFKACDVFSNVHLYPTNSLSRWSYIFDAIRIGKRIKGVDVVSSQDPFESGLAGWRIAKATKAKFHVQIHTDFLSPHFVRAHGILNRMRVLLARILLPKAAGIRVVSNRIRVSLKQAGYRLKQEPVVLPVFFDAEAIRAKKPAFDLHKNYPSMDPILLVVARLESEKNIGAVVNVLTEVRRRHPRAGLVIVGEGSEREKLEQLVKRQELLKCVVFEGSQRDVISYYKTADVVIQPSLYEGYGLAAAEALASGTPVLSTDVGAAKEMGATIAPIDRFGKVLSKMLDTPGRKAELKYHPYKGREAYLEAYQKVFTALFVEGELK